MLFLNNYLTKVIMIILKGNLKCSSRESSFRLLAENIRNSINVLDSEYYGLQHNMDNISDMDEQLKNYYKSYYRNILWETDCDDDGSYNELLNCFTDDSSITISYRFTRDRFVSLFNQSPFKR